MKQFVVVLGILCVASTKSIDASFYCDSMTFSQKQSYGEQLIPKMKLPTVILSLTQLEFAYDFGLAVLYNFKDQVEDSTQFSLKVSMSSTNTNSSSLKVTVQYVVVQDLPFLESIFVNFTKSQPIIPISSMKNLTFSPNVRLIGFCIGFTRSELTKDLFYQNHADPKKYLVQTNARFEQNDWLLINLIIIDLSPPVDLNCGLSVVVPFYSITPFNSSLNFERRQPEANIGNIFGIESIQTTAGNILYNPQSLSITVNKGVFSVSLLSLSVTCPNGKKTQDNIKTNNQNSKATFLILFIVFASLFGVLLILVLLYFLCCFRRHAEFVVLRGEHTSQFPARSLPESKIPSDLGSDKKSNQVSSQLSRPDSQPSKPGIHSRMAGSHPSAENKSEPEDPLTDTRIIHVPRRTLDYYKSSARSSEKDKPRCNYLYCLNNPYGRFPPPGMERRACPQCSRHIQQIQEIIQ